MKASHFIIFLAIVALLIASEWIFLSEYFYQKRMTVLVAAFLAGLAAMYLFILMLRRWGRDSK